MSQKVTIDYQGISIEVQAKCDTAMHSLCEIDKVLDRIHKTADKLETSKVKEYEAYLIESKDTIKNKIDDFRKTLEKYKKIKSEIIDSDYEKSKYNEYIAFVNRVKKESNELTMIANELTGSKLAVIDQMINEGLLNLGQETMQNMLNKLHGVVSISSDVLSKINRIDDISLRELAYKEILKNDKLSYDEAIAKAQEKYDIFLGRQTEKVIQEYKKDLIARGISSEKLDGAKSIDEANEIANDAITGETIRKETLKTIIKAIKDRGFIVDTKKNLKIDKERNIVKLVALKASGQMAEFEIQLNGKFMYHFDEYEGHACKKDIEPFLEDLKNIYDINILHEEVIWENPDKIQTQKYQYMNKNKGTN